MERFLTLAVIPWSIAAFLGWAFWVGFHAVTDIECPSW